MVKHLNIEITNLDANIKTHTLSFLFNQRSNTNHTKYYIAKKGSFYKDPFLLSAYMLFRHFLLKWIQYTF